MHQQQITKHIKHPHRYGGRHNGSQPCDSLVAFNQTITRATKLRKGTVSGMCFLPKLKS